MKRLLIYIIYIAFCVSAWAQNNEAYLQYIDTYGAMAVDQMIRHKVPASITLAQGLLESSAGRSMLAVNGNNHFGIKVGSSWTGPYLTKDDDKAGEHFRKYGSVEESYEDHSLFLKRQRYASLFDLDITDYRGWANGLKAAGYATNPKYPTLLISIIEQYDLTRYDDPRYIKSLMAHTPGHHHDNTPQQTEPAHKLRLNNDVVYVIALEGDTYESISSGSGISCKKLRKYNEAAEGQQPKCGSIVYLGKKKNHVAKPLRRSSHRVSAGESIHTISQLYGVRLKQLYRWNALPADYCPKVGDIILLR